ncbi:MAG: hypothetical protein NVS2B4_02740 [Ramlibacter sp.]
MLHQQQAEAAPDAAATQVARLRPAAGAALHGRRHALCQKVSVDMLTSVEAADDTIASKVMRGTSCAVAGKTLMARIVAPTPALPRPYHSLGSPTVSTIGAHSIFQVWTQSVAAMIVVIWSTLNPARPSRNASVTPT